MPAREWDQVDGRKKGGVKALIAEGRRAGEVITIEMSKSSNSSGPSSNSTAAVRTEKEIEEGRKRKDEIFDVNVGESARRETFRQIAAKIGEDISWEWHLYAEIAEGRNPSPVQDYFPVMVERMWEALPFLSDHTAKCVREMMPESVQKFLGVRDYQDKTKTDFSKLTQADLEMLLFLMMFGHYGEMYEGGSWNSQKAVTELARQYDVNYDLIDAQQSVLYPKLRKVDRAKIEQHLEKVKRGEAARADRPLCYSKTWKHED